MLGSFNPEELFGSIFQPELLQQNLAIESTLSTALDGLNSDKESNEQKIAEIEDALRALEQEREQQTRQTIPGIWSALSMRYCAACTHALPAL